jgi:hypothetical protein
MKKILVICPHLSTGGSGQVTVNKIQLMKDNFHIKVVEYSFLAWNYVVQRNRIIDLVGDDNFHSLGENKKEEIKLIIDSFKPDIISFEEFPEMFMSNEVATIIYSRNLFGGNYTIFETTHDSSFNPKNKLWMPDKFIFVSPYNALKYNHLDIEYEVIQYPVDKKERNKIEAREKLGLEHNYKHIVIIGLFTQRKNQGYAFQMADKLADYKVKFHFLGNQANNFSNYWQPLMDWKNNNPNLNNCIIWGERSDTEEFIKASDLFLFPSKGDKDNKELNPLVILEALEYDIPKMIFNLDVYLNKYNNTSNMHFLSGDLDIDTSNLIDIIEPNKIVNNEEVIILGTYPNLKSRVKLTKDTIKSLKSLNRKIILVSHYAVDEEIQKMVDYYIFDAYNPLTYHTYYTKFYNHTNDYDVEMNINGLKDSNQSLCVLTNIYNGAKLARELGFKRFFYTTYDVVLDERDIDAINVAFKTDKKLYVATLPTPQGQGIQTNGMMFDAEFFIKEFDDVRKPNEWNEVCKKRNCENYLEDYLSKIIFSFNPNDIQVITNEYNTLLINSGLGVSSNSEYYSILPIEGKPNKYIFYFYTYNIDDRQFQCYIDNNLFLININNNREWKQEFTYNGNNVIELKFYDEENCYKTDVFEMNPTTIEKYNKTGNFKYKNIKPKIKLVHLQTTLNDEREQKSRSSVQKVKDFGWEYVLHINEPYTSLPPIHSCLRPKCVSFDLFDDNKVQELGTALTPAHYGCFEAFKNAILCEFNDDIDFLMICEGDCIIEKPIEEFISIVENSCPIIENNKIGFMSYGDHKTLEHGWLQSPVIETIPNQDILYITNHIIGLQCIMFSKVTKKWLKEILITQKWDASDIYFNIIFKESEYKMGIVHQRITTQENGFSLIDKQDKIFI